FHAVGRPAVRRGRDAALQTVRACAAAGSRPAGGAARLDSHLTRPPMFDFYFNWPAWLRLILQGLAVIMVIFPLAGACSMAERKVSAWMQGRPGPNRAIPFWFAWVPVLGPMLQRIGVFHLMADGAKFLFKEEPVPAH